MWRRASKYSTTAFIDAVLDCTPSTSRSRQGNGPYAYTLTGLHPSQNELHMFSTIVFVFPNPQHWGSNNQPHVLSLVLWRVVLSLKLTVPRLMQITSIDSDFWLTIRRPASPSACMFWRIVNRSRRACFYHTASHIHS